MAEEKEVNPNDPEVRKMREDAIEYADRVLAGEEPWKDRAEDDGYVAPKDDYVGEDGGTDSDPVEVADDIAEAPALDADDPVEGDEGVPAPDDAE